MTHRTITLADLAARAISRDELRSRGFRALTKSNDLNTLGYVIIDWLAARTLEHVVEYRPMSRGGRQAPERISGHYFDTRWIDVPRFTATCYEEQAEIHRALGLHIVGRGQPWRPVADGQGTLALEWGEGSEGIEAA